MMSDGEVCDQKQCRATAVCQRPQQECGGCLSSYMVASIAQALQGPLGTDLRRSRWKAPWEGAGADRPSLCRLFLLGFSQFMVFVCFVSLSCFLLLMCPHAVSLQALSPT